MPDTKKSDWDTIIDKMVAAVGITGAGGKLYNVVSETKNKNLRIAFECAACGSTMYFAGKHLTKDQMNKGSPSPNISCPQDKCKHSGNHKFLWCDWA